MIVEFYSSKFATKPEFVEYLNKFREEVERLEVKAIKRNQTLDQTFDEWKDNWGSNGTDLDAGIIMR